jgi:hypothetical protein
MASGRLEAGDTADWKSALQLLNRECTWMNAKVLLISVSCRGDGASV